MVMIANTSFVICYIDSCGTCKYSICSDKNYIKNGEFDINTFKKQNPSIIVTNVFKSNDNIINASNTERADFEKYCAMYGFSPEDYKAEILNPQASRRHILVGFLPRNNKYKIRLYCPDTGRYSTTTPELAHKYISREHSSLTNALSLKERELCAKEKDLILREQNMELRETAISSRINTLIAKKTNNT